MLELDKIAGWTIDDIYRGPNGVQLTLSFTARWKEIVYPESLSDWTVVAKRLGFAGTVTDARRYGNQVQLCLT